MDEHFKDLLDNGTFCVLPWIHDFRHPDGQKHICCVSRGENLPLDDDINSKSTKELRRKIYNGEKIPNCQVCYNRESNGITSDRQSQSLAWYARDNETKEYCSTITADTPPKLFYYDIRYDSKCNLGCITCGPQSSSFWQKELNIPVVKHQLTICYNDMQYAKKIYLAGGEPLIIDEHISLLDEFSKNRPEIDIVVNTNLTSLKPKVLNILKNLKNLRLIISVDCWGDSLEYVRYPLKWNKFLKNLEAIKEAGIIFQFNTVVSAVSVLGWNNLNKLDEFGPVGWHLFPIEYPVWIKIENLPTNLKTQAYNNILQMKASKFYLPDSKFKQVIDYYLNQVMVVGDSELLRQKIKILDQRRNIDHSKYLGVKF